MNDNFRHGNTGLSYSSCYLRALLNGLLRNVRNRIQRLTGGFFRGGRGFSGVALGLFSGFLGVCLNFRLGTAFPRVLA